MLTTWRGNGGVCGNGTVPVQDACLVCMIRLVADCEKVPSEIVDAVRTLKEGSKAYIRKVRLVGAAVIFVRMSRC